MKELDLERFKKKGIDYDIQNPEERWKNLLSDLRYLGNSAWPTLNKGEVWGDWLKADVISYFAKVVDALRSIYFPVMPPEKGDEKYNSSYWELYRKASEYMDSEPPPKDKVEDWDKKREKIIESVVKEAEDRKNAPTFAYITVTGEKPEDWISGRTEHEEKEWNGYRVDKHLKDEWLEALNDIEGIEVRSSCEGHEDGRFAFVMLRFEDEENDSLGGKLAGFLNRFDDVYSKAEAGNAGRIRICVAGDTWYGEDDWEGFWSNLPGWIEKSVTEVLKKSDDISEGVFDGELREKFEEIKDIGPIILRPEYISISGSIAFSPGRSPNDIEWIIRDNRFGTGETLKVERLSKKIFPDIDPDLVLAMEGPNWRYLPVFDLALIPRDNPEFRETDKPGFRNKFYEGRRIEEAGELSDEAEKSEELDEVSPGRYFQMMKPVRISGTGVRQNVENLKKFLEEDTFDKGWYASKKFDGMAVEIHKEGNDIKVFSEDGEDITRGFPNIIKTVGELEPETLVLCSEIEYWEDGEHRPREVASGTVHDEDKKDENLIANIFDILYFNGEDIHKLPFEKRLEYMDKAGIPQSTDQVPDFSFNLNLVPNHPVKNKENVDETYNHLSSLPGSEGFVLKHSDSPYNLDGNPRGGWYKLHKNILLRGRVIKRTETKDKGVYTYDYGILPGDYKISQEDRREIDGKDYIMIGTSFATDSKAVRGDFIQVETETINFIEDKRNRTVKVTAWVPRFFSIVEGPAQSISEIVSLARREGILQEKTINPEGEILYEAKNPYMIYPEESREWKYIAQHHWRGKSVHTDLRFETEDYLVGWTISDQIEGEVEEAPETLSDAKSLDSKDIFKIDWDEGTFKKRRTEEGEIIDANLRAIQKKKEPLEWLDFEGVTKPGEVGATEDYPGVFHIIDEGRVEWGAQKVWFHEYFLSGGGNLQGRIAFRLLERQEEQERRSVLPPGTPEEEPRTEAFWIAMQPDDQTPYVLSEGAIDEDWLPPQGTSALPEVIREQVPVNLRYWNYSGDKALELRKTLVSETDFDYSRIKEAEDSPEFVLQRKWYRGPIQVRYGPTEEIWYIRIKKDGEVFNLALRESPLDNEKVAGIEESPEASGYMDKGKEGTEYLEPGTDWNDTKETPAYIRARDWGDIVILEDSPNWKKIEFRGEKNELPELWYFKRENPDSDIWQMSRSQVPKPAKESDFPLTFDVGEKRYILRKTRRGGLVLNKLEKNI